MNRIVLALLALLAGLVSQTAPAQARLGGAGPAEMAAQMPRAAIVVAQAARADCRPIPARAYVAAASPCSIPLRNVAPVTVLIGIDRARE